MKLTVDLLTMAHTTFFQDYMYQKSTVDSLTPMMQPVPEGYDDIKLQTMYMSYPKLFLPSTEAVSTLSFKSNHVLPLYSPRNIIIL